MLDWIQEANGTSIGVVLKASAFARTWLMPQSTVKVVSVAVTEVHVSNIFLHHDRPASKLSRVGSGVITGFGVDSYRRGMLAVCNLAGVKI